MKYHSLKCFLFFFNLHWITLCWTIFYCIFPFAYFVLFIQCHSLQIYATLLKDSKAKNKFFFYGFQAFQRKSGYKCSQKCHQIFYYERVYTKIKKQRLIFTLYSTGIKKYWWIPFLFFLSLFSVKYIRPLILKLNSNIKLGDQLI